MYDQVTVTGLSGDGQSFIRLLRLQVYQVTVTDLSGDGYRFIRRRLQVYQVKVQVYG